MNTLEALLTGTKHDPGLGSSDHGDVDNLARRPTLAQIYAARGRIAPYVRRTPLIELELNLPDRRIFLKLETFQATGAFKVRPALNALLSRSPDEIASGVATTSSGNMAYGMAWAARKVGVAMAAYMVGTASESKIEGVRHLGGTVRFVSDQTWWNYILGADRPEASELLINPVTDPAVLAGNGTIGLEIVEDLPDVDVVLTPYGGGGLTAGVASAVKALKRDTRVFAVESEHATPVTGALLANAVVTVAESKSFIRSIGGPSVLPQMWPLVSSLIDGAAVVSLEQVVQAMAMLYSRAKTVVEGAGAVALAAALSDPRIKGNIVCVVSGGNIDIADYIQALQGQVPIVKL